MNIENYPLPDLKERSLEHLKSLSRTLPQAKPYISNEAYVEKILQTLDARIKRGCELICERLEK